MMARNRIICGALVIAIGAAAPAQQAPPSRQLMVFFDWGKPEIRGDDQAVLDQAAALWRSNPEARLQLSGHTDRSGSAAYNLRASRKRADTVRAMLAARGVPASAMTLAAYGEERPLVSTEDGVREVQNRRVEIALEVGAPAAASGMLVPFPIRGPGGEPRGYASFFSDGRETRIEVQTTGLPIGLHGIHLHAVGRCGGPDFKSAGAHWNPAGKQHGRYNPLGTHLGDLPNLSVGNDGDASASFTIQGDMADADGTSLVIHAAPDDEKTDPSGNSGERIACAVLTTPQP